MNAFELLKSDHDKAQLILEKLAQTTDRAIKTREELFSKLKEELEIHSYIEEVILYPALKEEAQTRDLTIQAVEKHRMIAILLDEIGDLPVDHEQWGAKFKILKEIVESHIKDEEGELFRNARAALSKERIDELGAELETEKQHQQTEEGAAVRGRALLSRPAELRMQRKADTQRKADKRVEKSPEVRVKASQGCRQPLIYFNLSCSRIPFSCRR